jgi:hypothetical protein
MDKRRITAKEILRDIRAGASDSELMKKYALSAQGVQSVLTKLLNSKLVTQAELDDRVPVSERTVDLGLFICPACGNIQGREFVQCPRCNFIAPQRSKQATATTEVQNRKEATKTVVTPSKRKTAPSVTQADFASVMGLAEQSIRDLARTATYCRTLGIAVLTVYFLIVLGIFVTMQISQGINPTSAGFLAVALMGIPAVAIGLILFVVLKALAESVTVFVNATDSLSKIRPPA